MAYINLFHIILLQETWEEEEIVINGFDLLTLRASPSLKGGRPKGGLVIGVSLKLHTKLSFVQACPPYVLSGLITGEKISLLISNVYLPPGGRRPELCSRWDSLEDHLLSCHIKCPNIPSIIGGDFNARTAANWDSLTKTKWWTTPCFDNYEWEHVATRISKDSRVNEAGVIFYLMAIRLNLVFLNGRYPPDIPGEFTHLGTKSNSVLDYLLVSRDLAKSVLSFKVDNVQISDHLPLTATLSLVWQGVDHRHFPLMEINAASKLRGIKWSEVLALKYKELFQKEIQVHPIVSISDSCDPSAVLNLFSHLTANFTAFFTSPSQTVTRAQYNSGAPWYNSVCKQAKLQLRSIYNEYKNSGASSLPSIYFQAKLAYKQALKMAKREWQSTRWQALILASKSRRANEFWSLINSRTRKYPLTVIPAPTWEQFLRKCFSQAEAPVPHLEHLFEHLPRWPPTDPGEISVLISQLKVGKAPGPDLVPAEAIKSHPEWWSGILAKTFDAINVTGCIPKTWKEAIIIPIYKKGPPADPGNYRSISLLSTIGKIYARLLLSKLSQWAEESNLIGHEQAGFRPNRSTIDHAIILYHLARKYSFPSRGRLCAAFIDLKAAFDSIPRTILWEKLARWGIDKRLLWLMIQLHGGSSARIRLTPAGDLTNAVPINKGVRQGCILAPYLFNLFVSDMREPLNESHAYIHAPRIANYRCPLLLYADDAVILSYSRVGLCRALKIFTAYCQSNQLSINHSKSKVVVFSRSRKLFQWKLGGVKIDQVFKFQYLGIVFQYNLSWKSQVLHLLNKGKTLSHALLQFFFSDGALHVPSALKVYNAKVITTLTYAAPLWAALVNPAPLEVLQNQFLRRLLKLPTCVSNAAIRLELKIPSLETLLWKRIFTYWLTLWHRLPSHYLVQCLWRDEFANPWTGKIHAKLLSFGISPSDSLKLDLASAKRLINQRLDDLELQRNHMLGGGVCSPRNFGVTPIHHVPLYLSSLSTAGHRFAFTKARFNVFPSNVLRHRFSKGLVSAFCDCDKKSTESLHHIIFICSLHSEARAKLLRPITQKLTGAPAESHLALLLQDNDSYTTLQVARFLNSVISQKRRCGQLHDH